MTFPAHIRNGNIIQSCTEHCRNTATIAGNLLTAVGLKNTAYLSGLLHDMGKFHADFDRYIRAVSSGNGYDGEKVIHTFTGVSFILTTYHNGDAVRRLTAETIALAVGSHHSLFDIYHELDNENAFKQRIEKQPEYDKTAIKNSFAECAIQEEIDELFSNSVKEISAFLARLKPLCEKQNNGRIKQDFYLGLLARLVMSAVIEGDRRDTSAFMSGKEYEYIPDVDWKNEIASLNTSLNSFQPVTEIEKEREKISDVCFEFAKEPGDIYRLDIPSDGEKTLASLRYALNHAEYYGKRRVFYVAPYLTMLEQSSKIIRSVLPYDTDILLHYSNIVDDTDNGDMLNTRELLQDSWESKIVITSLVQILLTMFSGEMSSVRRFNTLVNSVIIFDGFQSLPIRLYSMFNLTVNFLAKCCGSTVVLCSNALPGFDSVETYRMVISPKQMIPQSLLDSTIDVFRHADIRKWPGRLKFDEVFSVVIRQLEVNDSILLVCNMKSQAKNIYQELQAKLCDKGVELYHLSAGMCPRHCRDTLEDLSAALKSGKKVICISTQVIEAGTDIVFDCVLRFAAGLDNVLQSAACCKDRTYILDIEDEKLPLLREIDQRKMALLDLLACYRRNPQKFEYDFASKKSVNRYFENLYKIVGKDVQDFPNPAERDGSTLLSLLSDNSQIVRNGLIDKNYMYSQSFETAGKLFAVFDDNRTTIFVPYNDEAEEIIAGLLNKNVEAPSMIRGVLKKAKNYSVSVLNPVYEKLVADGAVTLSPEIGIPCLSKEFYDDKVGILTAAKSKTLEKKGKSCCKSTV